MADDSVRRHAVDVTPVTFFSERLSANGVSAYAVDSMPSSMTWLATVIRIAIVPVLLGAVALVLHSPRASTDVTAAAGLLLLAAVHSIYWWDPWRRRPPHAIATLGTMVVINSVLLNLLGLAESLLWLYPALVAGAGLRTPAALVGIGLTALAAAAPLALAGGVVHPAASLQPGDALGPSHSVLLSIILAGLGMSAVRQLVATNAELHATRAELADLAVAADRERLARELHDLLARTLSLIAVKAELASRLSAKGNAASAEELADIQHLARTAVRDVREAVSGARVPSLRAELAAAESALAAAGIDVTIDVDDIPRDAAHETTLAWAVREAITNVVKHSGALTCRITVHSEAGSTCLEVEDDGRGAGTDTFGVGLTGLVDRVHALGGTLHVEQGERQGFTLRVRLDSAAPSQPNGLSAA